MRVARNRGPGGHSEVDPTALWQRRPQSQVQALSDRDLNRYKLKVSERAPDSPLVPMVVRNKVTVMVPEGIDPGFAYHPGKTRLTLRHWRGQDVNGDIGDLAEAL